MTASNAALSYQACVKHGLIDSSADMNKSDSLFKGIMQVAQFSQNNKPQAQSKKNAILEDLMGAREKSLILYCFLCLRHEAGMDSGISNNHLKTWFDVINEKLNAKGVPASYRYGNFSHDVELSRITHIQRLLLIPRRNTNG